MNVYYHDGKEWAIAAVCDGPHAAHAMRERLALQFPGLCFVVADRLPRG